MQIPEHVTTALVEALKIIASIAIPYIALLKTRTDLDRLAASQRAKESGRPASAEMRRRWYQPFFKGRRRYGGAAGGNNTK